MPERPSHDAASLGARLRADLESRARELGFLRLGIAAIQPLGRDEIALREWIEAGHHGSMQWMQDTLGVRLDPAHERMLPGAVRVVVLATPYARADGAEGPAPGRVARYARGRDYHNVVGKRMRKLARMVRESGHSARAGVDALPVLERAWGQRAGLGFIGKNSCLIIPGVGSHVFLSALLTDAPLPVDEAMSERCGSCQLCLDSCPTDAFVGERQLDARRCISYLTIEHRGAIPEPLRAPIGRELFGCDICQDVCPFNKTSVADAAVTEPFAAHARLEVRAEDLLDMDPDAFDDWSRGSPLRRARREGLARNAAIVLGNRGGRRHLPVLERAARGHDSEVVRDAATWAIRQLAEDERD